MSLYDLALSTVTASALMSAALFLAKNLIITRLTKAVEHDFNVKLEEVRAALKDSESELLLLRSNVLTGVTGRHAEIEKRRLEAIEQLWEGWYGFSRHQTAVTLVASSDFDRWRKEAERDPKVRAKVGELLHFDMDPLKDVGWRARPFVSPPAWALYVTYTTIIAVCVFKIKFFAGGDDSLLDEAKVIELVVVAFPERADEIRGRGVASFADVLNELEDKFFVQIENMLSGVESDEAVLRQSKRMLEAASEAHNKGAS